MGNIVIIGLLILGVVFFIFLIGLIAWAARYYTSFYTGFDHHQSFEEDV